MKPVHEPIPSEAMPAVERPAPPPTTLAMPQLVATGGAFPAREGGTPACLTMGMVHAFAGAVPVYGAPMAEGQMLPENGNEALYSIFFTTFGFEGQQNFGIPGLRGRAIVGGIQANQPTQTTLPMTWLIAAAPPPGADGPLIGSLAPFGGIFIPDGWLPCDGRMLAVNGNVALYEAIGNAFGGANNLAFALPGLNDLAVYGAGPGGVVGSAVVGPPAGLCLNYIVNIGGPVPPSGGNGGFPTNQYWLGQVIAYAGSAVPPGWALADGSLLNIADYPDLFDLLGHLYGGNGTTNFGLPDLRGKMLVGV
jgi:microcystin-dependent protein